MRKIIAISLLVFSSTSFSFELKLNCDVQSTYTYPTGRTERSNGKALIEVKDHPFERGIFISSGIDVVNNLTVTTFKRENKSIDDLTDMNKWDIRNIDITAGGTSTTRILIDRNSGMLIADRVFNRTRIVTTTQVAGTCNKIDTTTRKF